MKSLKKILTVDSGTAGYTKEFSEFPELLEEVLKVLINGRVLRIYIEREPQMGDPQAKCFKDSSLSNPNHK